MINKFRFFEGVIENEFVNVNFTSQIVRGEVRPLRATWSPQIPDELESHPSIDIVSMLSANLAQAIDYEIMEQLREMDSDDIDEFNENMIRDLTIRINGGLRA